MSRASSALGDYWLDMSLGTNMLITRHQDRPGTMGMIGQTLGKADVNISAMHLARGEPRADALMILALDEAVSPDVADRPFAPMRRSLTCG